jgi:hypothetical protein
MIVSNLKNSSGTPASLPECYLSQTDFFSCVLLLPTVALTFGKCRSSANGTCTLSLILLIPCPHKDRQKPSFQAKLLEV